jgi:hypothetical protein
MHRSLLVTNEYVLKPILLEDGVVNVENSAAGITEHMLDTLFGQTAHDNIGARDFRTHATSFQGPLEIDRMLSPDEIFSSFSLGRSFFVRLRYFVGHP